MGEVGHGWAEPDLAIANVSSDVGEVDCLTKMRCFCEDAEDEDIIPGIAE